MTGFDLWLSVLALGIVCNIYTALVISVIPGVMAGRWEKEEKGQARQIGDGMEFQGGQGGGGVCTMKVDEILAPLFQGWFRGFRGSVMSTLLVELTFVTDVLFPCRVG